MVSKGSCRWQGSNAHLKSGLVSKVMHHKGVEGASNSNLHSQGPLLILQTQVGSNGPNGVPVEATSRGCLLYALQEGAV